MSVTTMAPDQVPQVRARRRLLVGISISLLLHALVLSLRYGVPGFGAAAPGAPISVRLAQSDPPPAELPPATVPSAPGVPAPPVPSLPPSAAAPVTGMRLVAPRPAPVVTPKPLPKAKKPRKTRRVSSPVTRPQTDQSSRVIAQDAQPNDFVVAPPQPEESPQKPLDPTQAQQGTDDGTDAANAAAAAEEELRRQAALQQEQVEQEKSEHEVKEQEQRRVEAERIEQARVQLELATQRKVEEELATQAAAQRRSAELAVAEEAQRAEKKRSAQELAAQEQAARERLTRERADADREALARAASERAAQERLTQERAVQERQAQERAAQERQAQEQTARDKEAAEQLVRERADGARYAQERLAGERGGQQADPFGAGGGGNARGPGLGGAPQRIPIDMLGTNLGNRARELVRGLDLLKGAPPPTGARGERRVVVGVGERDVPLRLYADSWRIKIERNGSVQYPRSWASAGGPDALVSVVLRSDGTVEDVTIIRSSGRADIDEAVRGIVRLNARYAQFPPNIASRYDVIEIRRIWRFDEALKLIEELR